MASPQLYQFQLLLGKNQCDSLAVGGEAFLAQKARRTALMIWDSHILRCTPQI